MGCIKPVGYLNTEIQHAVDFQGLARNHLPERLPLEHFHRDECAPIDFINFMDRANVRMVQSRCGPGFAPESLQCLCVIGHCLRQELQSNVTAKLELFRLVYKTHAAAADFAENSIMRNSLSDGLGGRGH